MWSPYNELVDFKHLKMNNGSHRDLLQQLSRTDYCSQIIIIIPRNTLKMMSTSDLRRLMGR